MGSAIKTISQEVRELIDGLTPAQQESLLAEMLEVLATDPKEYANVNDYRVDTVEMLVDLRDSYERLAGDQMAQWDRAPKPVTRFTPIADLAERRFA
ncbi:hypothetical protein CURE108131_23055 [Cupriavidus respiraculi]|uniref:Uncharacterized protein n=1 Tax=Cupriavidus respiraculi TaxID=195930 RepID=A0ABM8WY19_9BURK|nr:hypothetical protein [Cupriavidus respiraculi]CAG9172468.1 hypothetical protein LMG21510_01984 [Cupriavidus respiraculi]